MKEGNKKIVGYGSPAKATTVLNYFGISSEDIEYIIEDNELKPVRKYQSFIEEITPKS